MVTMLTPSLEDIVAIEKATRRQHESKRWHEERHGRITSSTFGENHSTMFINAVW